MEWCGDRGIRHLPITSCSSSVGEQLRKRHSCCAVITVTAAADILRAAQVQIHAGRLLHS